jgi:hypothetical protein
MRHKGRRTNIIHLTPFKKGFAHLGELYFERTKQKLSFYPLKVHAESLTIRVGKPIRYNSISIPASERTPIKDLVESTSHEVYLRTSRDEIVQLPLPN